MEITSRKDKIELDTATGKFKKTSIITSEMSAAELRNYCENLIRHAQILEIELAAVRSEIAQIKKLLGAE